MPRKPKGPALDALLDAFSTVPDPRIDRTKFHPLVNVLTMALFGAICGADGWEALAIYAEERAEFFRTFLTMPKGTPSADTFRRVFEALDPKAFQDAFRRWLRPFLENLDGQTVALDGKTLRGALAHAEKDAGAFHLMHVWATEQRLLLAQAAVEGAPGEVNAAVELLKLLDLKGATVAADANSCTAGISRAIREAGADYVLALKGNRGALHKHVETLFDEAAQSGYRGLKTFDSKDEAHGRLEYRIVRAAPLTELPPRIESTWADLKTAVLVQRVRAEDNVTLSTSYYVTSHAPHPKPLAARIRGHWSIENQLHHCLDVSFAEDRRKIHDENGAQNFALVTRYALSLLKREPTKMSVAMKRRKAAWGETYLLKVLLKDPLGSHSPVRGGEVIATSREFRYARSGCRGDDEDRRGPKQHRRSLPRGCRLRGDGEAEVPKAEAEASAAPR
jgi:predicted transposase YbfD/YdcC